MTRNFSVAVCCLSCAVLAVPVRAAGFDSQVRVEQTEITTYQVTGGSSHEIWNDIHKKAAHGWAGYTHTNFHWTYKSATRGGHCQIDSYSITVSATTSLPKWKQGEGAPADLQARVARFENALALHEEGHKANAVRIANDLSAQFAAVPPQGDCAALDRLLREKSGLATSALQKEDVAYDERTNHGETQGAFLK
jgi:predicted secreted Zn-dependent protease